MSKQIIHTLYNGRLMPALGLGTWLSKPNQVYEATKHAIAVGYRHIDGAWIYENEHEIGHALQETWSDSIKREDIFITSKLWNHFHHPDDVRPAIEESLQKLQIDYLDLYLVHWPMDFARGQGPYPKDSNDKFIVVDPSIPVTDTWKAMESLVDAGLTKSIGLSNYTVAQIQEVIDSARIQPAVLQIEIHPYLQQRELREFCKKNNILVTSYTPLGNPGINTSEVTPLTDPTIQDIANKHGKTTAQVIIRWHLELDLVVIPKSVTNSRIEENLNVWDFSLTEEDHARIAALDQNKRVVSFAATSHLPRYPF